MPPADELASSSLLISCGIALVAVLLGIRQWYERHTREPDLSQADRVYFERQDLRRALGVAVILILAAGLSIGSRMPSKIQGRVNLPFVELWAGMIALILLLMTLAIVDLLATRGYAERQRRSIAHERSKLIRDAIREKFDPSHDSAESNGDSR